MKRWTLALYATAILLSTNASLNSQWPAVPVKSPVETLKAMKAANADLIEAQKKTLDTLDDIGTAAETIRIRGKRT